MTKPSNAMGKNQAKKLTRWLTGTDLGLDKSKDEVRKENDVLLSEYDQLEQEYKKLKGAIEQLQREYEQSKEYDFVRRYPLLKGMIKRMVVHLKLSADQNQQGSGGQIGGLVNACKEYANAKEKLKRREEKYSDMSTDDLTKENSDITDQIKELKRRLSMIEDLIEHMEKEYEGSKRFIPVQRYRLMKSMIKTVISNKYI